MSAHVLFVDKASLRPSVKDDEARVLSLAMYVVSCILARAEGIRSELPREAVNETFVQSVGAAAMQLWPGGGGTCFDSILAVAERQHLQMSPEYQAAQQPGMVH